MTTTMRGLAFTVALAAATIAVSAPPALAAPPTANQPYYTVSASYQGAPENLWEIAARFLGDAGRAGEILELNSGRVQPDGRRLADPSRLRAGWRLALPWDAAGTDLHYGPLPASGAPSADCERPAHGPAAASWAQTLLTPSKAWPVTDGSGVKVAVIASGVDGSAPELAGRVASGTDIAGGAGRGDTGCTGSGTALAGIVAGVDGSDGQSFGVAPGTRVVPVKVAGKLSPRLAARGIDVAAASGARVILVGAGVDARNAEVRGAISDAIARDVVVVMPAWAPADPVGGLIRVGAIAENRQPAAQYPAGTVDLLAPGIGVTSIGGPRTGGTPFAAAFVAGTVALVRAAHPELHAADVTRQVLGTAAGGVVSPVAAVTTPLPAGVGVNAVSAPKSNSMGTLSRVLLWFAIGLAVLMLLPFLLQRPARLVTGAVARHKANKQAELARARMADDSDDPFWEPPAGAVRTDQDEVTAVIPRVR